MTDDAAPLADDDAAPKGKGDFLKTYVLVMAFIAIVLGVLWWKLDAERRDYEQAVALAPRRFGTPDAITRPGDGRPNTIAGLGVDILKYLETYKAARPEGDIIKIPKETITDRVSARNLRIKGMSDNVDENNKLRYVEFSTLVTLDQVGALDEENFAALLYNLEIIDTRMRILDLLWTLRPDKENPYPPGNAIQNVTFRIGFRKPK